MSIATLDTTAGTPVIDALRNLLGDRLSTSQSVLEQHGRGESWHPVKAPDAVCFALKYRGSGCHRQALCSQQDTGGGLWYRHLAGGDRCKRFRAACALI